MLMPALKKLGKDIDVSEYGGAPLLGVKWLLYKYLMVVLMQKLFVALLDRPVNLYKKM